MKAERILALIIQQQENLCKLLAEEPGEESGAYFIADQQRELLLIVREELITENDAKDKLASAGGRPQ